MKWTHRCLKPYRVEDVWKAKWGEEGRTTKVCAINIFKHFKNVYLFLTVLGLFQHEGSLVGSVTLWSVGS